MKTELQTWRQVNLRYHIFLGVMADIPIVPVGNRSYGNEESSRQSIPGYWYWQDAMEWQIVQLGVIQELWISNMNTNALSSSFVVSMLMLLECKIYMLHSPRSLVMSHFCVSSAFINSIILYSTHQFWQLIFFHELKFPYSFTFMSQRCPIVFEPSQT